MAEVEVEEMVVVEAVMVGGDGRGRGRSRRQVVKKEEECRHDVRAEMTDMAGTEYVGASSYGSEDSGQGVAEIGLITPSQ